MSTLAEISDCYREAAGLTWAQLEEQFDSWMELEGSFFCHLEGEGT